MSNLLSPPPPSPAKLKKKRSNESTRSLTSQTDTTISSSHHGSGKGWFGISKTASSASSKSRSQESASDGTVSGSVSGGSNGGSVISRLGSRSRSKDDTGILGNDRGGHEGSYSLVKHSQGGASRYPSTNKSRIPSTPQHQRSRSQGDTLSTSHLKSQSQSQPTSRQNPQSQSQFRPASQPLPRSQGSNPSLKRSSNGYSMGGGRGGKFGEEYKRVRPLFCDVVVEGMKVGDDGGWEIPEATSSLLPHLGHSLPPLRRLSRTLSSRPDLALSSHARSLPKFNPVALKSRLMEFVETERSYVRRLGVLWNSYALPLRTFAKNKDSMIIPPFEARVLFGNVETLLGLNEKFLSDLNACLDWDRPASFLEGGEWVSVIKQWMNHFSGPYTAYLSAYPQAKGIEGSLMAATSQWRGGFARFCERTKQNTSGGGMAGGGIGNVGLRELLMEPIQRIPRYKLLIDEILKHVDIKDVRRRQLEEAVETATKIANCDLDEETFRANCMTQLQRNIEDCPADLISNSRSFIDCIDLVDLPLTTTPGIPFPSGSSALSASTNSTASGMTSSHSGGTVINHVLHCTLFLFTDKLLIAKRNTTSSLTGRALAGLEDFGGAVPESPRKVAGGGSQNGKKLKLKGVMELTDVVAVDKDGDELAFYFDPPPYDTSERWNGRPHRLYGVIPTTNLLSSITNTPETLQYEKRRFLNNLWRAQALLKTRDSRSAGLVIETEDTTMTRPRTNLVVGDMNKTVLTTFWNVYEKKQYLGEGRKGKMVLQIDPKNEADELGFGMESGPFAVARAHSEIGGRWKLSIRLKDGKGPPGEDELSTSDIVPMMVRSLDYLRLHDVPPRYPTAIPSPSEHRPSAPSTRTRSNTFGLDSISRSLLSRDVFGSIGSHKRTQSTASKVSVIENRSIFSASMSASTTATSVMQDGQPIPNSGSLLRRSVRSNKPSLSRLWSNSKASKSTPELNADKDEDKEEDDEDDTTMLAPSPRSNTHTEGDSTIEMDRDTTISKPTPKRKRPSSVPPPCLDHRPLPPSDNKGGFLTRPDRPMGPRAPSPCSTSRPTDGPLPESTLPGSPEQDPDDDDMVNTLSELSDSPKLESFTSEPEDMTVDPLITSTPPPRSPPRLAKRPLPDPLSPRSLPPAAKRPALDTLASGNVDPSAPFRKVSPLRIKRKDSVDVPRMDSLESTSMSDWNGQSLTGNHNVDRLKSPPQSPQGGRVDALRSSLMRKFAQEASTPSHPVNSGLTRSPSTLDMITKFESRARNPPSRSRFGHPGHEKLRQPTETLEEEDWKHRSQVAEARCLEMQRTIEALTAENGVLLTDNATLRAEREEAIREVESVTHHSKQLAQQLDTVCQMYRQLEEQNRQHQAEDETMIETFNEELETLAQDLNLPTDIAKVRLMEDLRKVMESRNKLENYNRQLRDQLVIRQPWEAILRENNLLPNSFHPSLPN